METLITTTDLLRFNSDTLQAVRKIYNLDKPGAMDHAIDIFAEWVKKQNHFVKKDFDRDYLERTIIVAAKGSVERAKGRLDKICTMRTLMPHFFQNYDLKKDFPNLGTLTYTPMPKLTKNNDRIIVVKTISTNFDSSTLINSYKICAVLFDYLRAHDYANSYIFVCNMFEANLSEIIPHMNLMELRQLTSLILEGYGVRMQAIHMITSSKLIDVMVSIMKQALSAKISQRIQVHKTFESVYEHVPKELLPSDFGGEERPLTEMNDEWIELLNSEEFRNYRREMNKACSDESLRQSDKFNEQYMGMPGTFRTLSVD